MNHIFKLTLIIIIFSAGNIYAFGSRQTAPLPAAETAVPVQPVPEPTRAERSMRAIKQAYPEHIEKVEFRNDDWALFMKDKWYYFAEGRMLPENMLESTINYRSYQFYHYPAELPPWTKRSEEEIARFNSWTSNRRQQTQLRRSSFFLDDLWQAGTRAEAERRLVRITFLGRPARVHQFIQGKFSAVEARIQAAAKVDPVVQTWINNIGTLESYGWRNIADTQARSYHSYGLAVDILPRNLGNRQTYWLWTSQYRSDWYNVSYNERYHPPAAVISAFEANGFVWGGKWPMFDTMHFEYRPEILIFNGMPPEVK